MSRSTVAPGGLSDLRLPGILGEKLGFEPSLEKAWETQLEAIKFTLSQAVQIRYE